MGIGLNEKLSETYSQKVSKSVSQALTYDYDVTYHTKCTAKEGIEGVGLFQQVIYSTDGKLRAHGVQTVCRYGDLWKTAPECPFEACVDPECLKCYDDWKN